METEKDESPKENGDKPETEKPDVEMKATPKSKAKRGVKARTGIDSFFLIEKFQTLPLPGAVFVILRLSE